MTLSNSVNLLTFELRGKKKPLVGADRRECLKFTVQNIWYGLACIADFVRVIMSQANRVDCPICGRSFPACSVNEHVNKCLNANEPRSTTEKAGAKIQDASVISSPTGTVNLSDKSTGFFGKRSGTKGNISLMESPPSSALKRSFATNSSNLAGKSNETSNNPPFKRLKPNETTNSSKSSEFKRTNNIAPFTSGTKGPVSSQNSNSSFSGKKVAQKSKSSQFMPLAERMRPKTLAEYVGQSKVLGGNSLLRTLLEAEEIPSMILWGPPGCGKVN